MRAQSKNSHCRTDVENPNLKNYSNSLSTGLFIRDELIKHWIHKIAILERVFELCFKFKMPLIKKKKKISLKS